MAPSLQRSCNPSSELNIKSDAYFRVKWYSVSRENLWLTGEIGEKKEKEKQEMRKKKGETEKEKGREEQG